MLFHAAATAWLLGEAMVAKEIQSLEKAKASAVGKTGVDGGDPATSASQASNDRPQRRRLLKRLLMGAVAACVLAVAAVIGIPWIKQTLNTVSTDDAYVNGHVTFVSARVPGQVSKVLVDDNNRVHKGDLLAELDKEPYQVIVAIKKAAVDIAKADLASAEASVRGIEAKAWSQRWKLQHAIEDVDNQIKLLQAKIAALDKSKASLKLAEVEFERVSKLVATGLAASREQFDQREAALSVARADVTQALADIHQIRVSLGLPVTPARGEDLGQVPPDLDETFSSVREAQAELIDTAAELGVSHTYNQTPKQMVEEFEKRNSGDVDVTLARLVPNAPAVKQARAKLESAERDLDQAELNLRYCRIVADIDGIGGSRDL